uniref:Uncharacterized protein n=1 Tax=Anthurium amnicola TaxID=1678845 RepID=A0A1D1ZLX4_9ARAE
MLESRDRLARGVAAWEPDLGLGIRFGIYHDALREAAFGPQARRGLQAQAGRAGGAVRSRTQLLAEGDENVPPEGSRSTRRRGSPLPAWHQRTPLRDITALMNAMERRRVSLRLAARQRRNQDTALSPPSGLQDSPSPLGLTVPSDVPDNPALPGTGASPPAVENSPPHTPPLAPSSTAAGDPKLTEAERKLEKSIHVIEKAVKENLKRTLKVNDGRAVQRRTLLSMR